MTCPRPRRWQQEDTLELRFPSSKGGPLNHDMTLPLKPTESHFPSHLIPNYGPVPGQQASYTQPFLSCDEQSHLQMSGAPSERERERNTFLPQIAPFHLRRRVYLPGKVSPSFSKGQKKTRWEGNTECLWLRHFKNGKTL